MAANSGQSPLSASPARHAPYASTATGAARASDVPGPSQQQQGPSQPFGECYEQRNPLSSLCNLPGAEDQECMGRAGLDVWLEERKQWRAPNASAKAPKRDPVIA